MKDITKKLQSIFKDETVVNYILDFVDKTDEDFSEYNLAISVGISFINQLVSGIVPSKYQKIAVEAIIECIQEDF